MTTEITIAVDAVTRILATTHGRDKLYRLIQYTTRFLVPVLVAYGGSKDLISRLNALKVGLGQTRKCGSFLFFYGKNKHIVMRAAKWIDFLRAAGKATTIRDGVERASSVLRSLSMAVYMFLDTLTWINAVKIYHFSGISSIQRRAFQAWFFALVVGWLNSTYKLRKVSLKQTEILKLEERGKLDMVTSQEELDELVREKRHLIKSGSSFLCFDIRRIGRED